MPTRVEYSIGVSYLSDDRHARKDEKAAQEKVNFYQQLSEGLRGSCETRI